jgi:hypothetical protein
MADLEEERRDYSADLDTYQGHASRTCPKCGVTITVEKPTRVLSRTSNRAWRKKSRQEIARQILWEACCDDCRKFWNTVLRKIETADYEEERDGEVASAA